LIESSSAWKNVYIQNIPKYQPKEHQAPGIAFQVTSESTGSSHTSAEISLFFFAHGTTAGSFEPIVYVYVEFGLP
jgi:hypothetical protein